MKCWYNACTNAPTHFYSLAFSRYNGVNGGNLCICDNHVNYVKFIIIRLSNCWIELTGEEYEASLVVNA